MIDFCKKFEEKQDDTASRHIDNDGLSNAIPVIALLAQNQTKNEEKKNDDTNGFPEDIIKSIIGSITSSPDVIIRGLFICKLLFEIISTGKIKDKKDFAKLLYVEREGFLKNEKVVKDDMYKMVYKEVCDVMNDVGIVVTEKDDDVEVVFDDGKRRFKSQRECVGTKNEYGKPCGNPGSFKGPLHNVLINGDDYKQAVLDEIESGGDNCSRLQISGSIIGAMKGYNVIPKEWVDKTDIGKEALKMCDKLYAESKL